MDCVVNVTEGWAIGCAGRLQLTIHADMRHFRALTTGRTVILGRKTLATFPGGRPLPKRRNIVLTRSVAEIEGAECVASVEELFALPGFEAQDAVVIGGESVYRALLPYCERAYVTKTALSLPADAWFPNLDERPDWSLEEEGEELSEDGVRFRFCTYRKR